MAYPEERISETITSEVIRTCCDASFFIGISFMGFENWPILYQRPPDGDGHQLGVVSSSKSTGIMILDASSAPRTRLCLRIRPGIRASSFSPLFSGGFLEGHFRRPARKSFRAGRRDVGLCAE